MTEDRDFEQEELERTRFDPNYDPAFNEYIDVPKGPGGFRVPNPTPLELIRKVTASTCHISEEADRRLISVLPYEGDRIDVPEDNEAFAVIRTDAGYLIRKLFVTVYPENIDSLVKLTGSRKMFYDLFITQKEKGLEIDEVCLDRDGPVYNQYEVFEWS